MVLRRTNSVRSKRIINVSKIVIGYLYRIQEKNNTSASDKPPISMTVDSSRVTAQESLIPVGTGALTPCQPLAVNTSLVDRYPVAKLLNGG